MLIPPLTMADALQCSSPLWDQSGFILQKKKNPNAVFRLHSSFLAIFALAVFHNSTVGNLHHSESLTCLMACWTLSRLMSLASLSSVFSSILSIDTLYWHSSTTTTSGCTARIVCVRYVTDGIRKHRKKEINGKWAAWKEAKTIKKGNVTNVQQKTRLCLAKREC